MARRRASGFTMIELMIALAIAALLVVLAMPGYGLWIADAQIRNGAESIASGMRHAQGEAIKRNSQVEFVLDPTPVTGGWIARLVSDGSTLQAGRFAEGADRDSFTAVPAGSTTVTFTGLGGISGTNADGSAVLNQVQVRLASVVAGARDLNVLVGGGASGVAGQGSRTGIKICDPKWPATDPKGCPA